ncbi:MAG TPA: hypothetical protein VLG40_00950 [Candidatus Saccharimonas sp.]|nr:hypothetical protein [Candidatus Saccharimonas sp.]
MFALHFFANTTNDSKTTVDPTTIGIPKVPLTDSTVASVLSTVFVVVGSMAVLFMLIGAARYITSADDPAKVKQAKNTLIYAAVGLIVAALGFTVVQFIIGRLTGSLTS